MVLREPNDPLNQSRGIMGPLENSAVQNNRGRLRQRFDLIRKLGQGTYGKVQLGIDKETGQEVAIKTIKKSKIETEADLIRIRREIQIMSSVRHPNIIHIYEVFENREKMVLVMEYAAGGELYDYLNDRKILQEDEARRIFRQIASAVYYCHKHKICHRDLKLENILLDEKSNAKIADFGLSNVFDDINLLKTFCGSPLYASPEIVRGTPYYGPEVDCWSLGVLLYTLVYGAMPFDGSNFKRLVKQISNGDYYEPKKPAEASLLIKLMLTVDPVKRASIKDVCSHQWINQGFDKICLSTAEELANQTPVRLDLLLSLAPAYNINQSQVVIPCDQNEAGAAAAASSTGAAPSTEIPGPSDKKQQQQQQQPGASGEPKVLSGQKKSTDKETGKKQAGTSGSSKPTPAVAPFEKPARTSLTNKEKDATPSKVPGPIPPPSGKGQHGEGTTVKRKAAVKKKSKSSPVLELIVDEEENELEHRRLEDIIDGAAEDDDDAGDTLSEISEIQTIAEDIKDVGQVKSKSKAKVKEELKEVSTPIVKKDKEEVTKAKSPKVENQSSKATPAQVSILQDDKKDKKEEKAKTAEVLTTPTPSSKPTPKPDPAPKSKPTSTSTSTPQEITPVAPVKTEIVDSKPKIAKVKEKEPVEKLKEEPPKEKQVTQPQKEKIVPEPEAVEVAKEKVKPKPKPAATATDNETVSVKSSVLDAVTTTTAPTSTTATTTTTTTTTTATTKPPTVKKKVIKQKAVDKDKGTNIAAAHTSSATCSSSSVASSVGGKSGTKLDKDTSSTSSVQSTKTPKLRARSDSTNSSDASPTRIERRSSKIISQKTAELIQNLETKTSTSSTDTVKPKKLLFPSLKVSDAKRAFEKPPKPVKETSIVSSSSRSSAEENKKDKPKEKTVVKKEIAQPKDKETPSELTIAKSKKSKSPSPCTGTEDEDKDKNKDNDLQGKKSPKSPNKLEKDTLTKQESTAAISKKTATATVAAAVEEKKSEAKPLKKPSETKESCKVAEDTPKPIKQELKQDSTPVPKTPSSTLTSPTLEPPGIHHTAIKQKSKSPSPKPPSEKKPVKQSAVLTIPVEKMPLSPSPEPDTDNTMTVSDDLNTEIDMSISELSMTEPAKKSSVAIKPLKKLKIQSPTAIQQQQQQQTNANDQLVKPVMVDNGNGPPKQVVMLVSGKTTPPVKNSAELSSEPFFSQSDSISASISKDKKLEESQQQHQPNQNQKEKAVKKISSVISKIASSESAERLLREGKSKNQNQGTKTIKTEVEKPRFPVASAPSQERIIPIQFISDDGKPITPVTPGTPMSSKPQAQSASAPNISRTPLQRKMDASSSTVFSRQNSSDTESSIAPPPKPEPIRKSPREFIIPIKLEHSGQTLTPKEDISEASSVTEDPFRMDSRLRSGRFGRHKRYSSLLSDSSLEEEPVSISATTSRRSSAATAPSHARSHSQGDEPDTPTTPLGTFKRMRRAGGGMPLDRSDSFSSAEEDEEDAFEVLTAESLFSSLLDRVRNLTKRLNRDEGPTPNWPGPESPSFGLWGTSNPLREFMSRAPSESKSYVSSGPGSYTMTRSFSREPSVTVTISSGPGWRRSLSREMSGDSDSASAFSEPHSAASASVSATNPPSRSGSMFQSRGSFTGIGSGSGGGGGDETCTVRSLPLNLGSTRRSPFLSQRSEPHGVSDTSSSNLSSMAYNPPTARPYGRTLSNNEFSTSVTLPFRRSVKTYDRPNYNLQTDYSSPSSGGTHSSGITHPHSHQSHSPSDHHNFPSQTSGHISSVPHHSSHHHQYGGIPHRSNSVMARYTGNSSTGINTPSSNLDPSSSESGPYNASRYTRSLSRARTTPDQDIQRYHRDFSIPRQVDVPGSTLVGQNPVSNYSNNLSRSGEGNGWVGGSTSSSTKTAAATAKMTTQEKMNSYQNYYQSLNQNPMRRFQLPESPAAPQSTPPVPAGPYDIHHERSPSVTHDHGPQQNPPSNGFTSHTNSAFTRPTTMYETSFYHSPNTDDNHLKSTETTPTGRSGVNILNKSVPAQPSTYDSHPRTNSISNSNSKIGANKYGDLSLNSRASTPSRTIYTASAITRDATSPPMALLSDNSTLENSNLNSGTPSNANYSTPSNIPKWPNITIKTHRPVNVANFNDAATNTTHFKKNPNPMANQNSNQNPISQQHSNQNLSCSSPPLPQSSYRVMSPPPLKPPPPFLDREIYLKSPPPVGPPLSSSSNYRNQSQSQIQNDQKLAKRDSRATSVEKITRFLERRSMSRDRVISPPPVSQTPPPSHQSISVDIHVEPLPLVSNVETITVEEARNSNSSPVKTPIPHQLQKTNSKPKFLQSLEKKWEKLTTSGSSSSVGPAPVSVPSSTTKPNTGDEVLPLQNQAIIQSQENSISNKEEDILNLGRPDSESLLLQRAVSPEKKPKAKFGSSTVNFMLGKFRKIEETSGTGPTTNANSNSKIPAGRPPPSGSINTRIGRRVQSVYAGACSDSVLTLPRASVEREIITNPKESTSGGSYLNPKSVSSVGHSEYGTSGKKFQTAASTTTTTTNPTSDVSKSSTSNVQMQQSQNLNLNSNSSVAETIDEESKLAKTNRLRRPLSLGIFSNNNSGSSTSTGIPRLNRQNVAAVAAAAEAEHVNANANANANSPSSHIVKSPVSPLSSSSVQTPTKPPISISIDDRSLDDAPLTPTSPTDSFDSSSICSEKTEMSIRSVLDDEESVSDRIFRKSFYPRFNSLDRKKSSSMSSSASARHYSQNSMKTSKSHHSHSQGGTTTSATTNAGLRSSASPKISKSSIATTSPSTTGPILNTPKSELILESGSNPSSSISTVVGGNRKTVDSMNMSNGSSNKEDLCLDSTSSKINKYNPNPLFKELITDEFKSDVGRKAEYSRRVTSKLSKLLREIESDIGSSCSSGSGSNNNPGSKDSNNPTMNKNNKSLTASNSGIGLNSHAVQSKKSLSPSPARNIYDNDSDNNVNVNAPNTNSRSSTNNTINRNENQNSHKNNGID